MHGNAGELKPPRGLIWINKNVGGRKHSNGASVANRAPIGAASIDDSLTTLGYYQKNANKRRK